ncbi:MAG: hypothetical protein RLZZ440_357 [Planctomycetota bacterium]
MSVSVIRYVGADGRPVVGEDQLARIWRQMVAEAKVEDVFYAGGVASLEEFVAFAQRNAAHMVLAADAASGAPRGLAWLTNVHDGSAFLHHCSLGGFSRAAARAALAALEALEQPDGQPLLDRLLGITPEANTAALRVLRLMGFRSLGTIPGYCRLAHRGGRCGGVISFYECRQRLGRRGADGLREPVAAVLHSPP